MNTQPAVLYEDNHLLILNKPSGWLVQGDKTGDRTLTDWGKAYIKEKYRKPGEVFLHPAHRLDRPVSGITIFARTSKALERMNKLFRDDNIQKTYLAIVKGSPDEPEATLKDWLIKNPHNNVVSAYSTKKPQSKLGELSYSLSATDKHHSLLTVYPKTGRPHQIRVQLSNIGCPIKGDLKYGYTTPNPDKSISLHAFAISFVHPVRREPFTLKCKPNWDQFKDILDELD